MAVKSAPTPPPAPGLFSTTTGCPSATDSFSLIVRARMSVVPPGAKGTMYLIGLLGQVCAYALPAAANAAAANITTTRIALFIVALRCILMH